MDPGVKPFARELIKTVVIANPSKYLGRLTTGGLGATDIGNKAAVGGISREFYQRIARHYARESSWPESNRALRHRAAVPGMIGIGIKGHSADAAGAGNARNNHQPAPGDLRAPSGEAAQCAQLFSGERRVQFLQIELWCFWHKCPLFLSIGLSGNGHSKHPTSNDCIYNFTAVL